MKHYSKLQWSSLLMGNVGAELENQMQEHLLECEDCLNIYLSLIESTEMNNAMCLPEDFTIKVMNTIHEEAKALEFTKRRKTYTNLVVCYVSAACITLLLMSSGVFDFLSKKIPETSAKLTTNYNSSTQALLGGWTDKLLDKTSGLVNSFTEK